MISDIDEKRVIVEGYVGNFGTKVLIEKKRNELLKYFSDVYLSKIISDVEYTMKKDNLGGEISRPYFIADSEIISKGGVLASLWKICERNKVGLEYNLRNIPILQGTVEIANYFDINPYRLLTANAKILLVEYKKIDSFSREQTALYEQVMQTDSYEQAMQTALYEQIMQKDSYGRAMRAPCIKMIGRTNNKKKRVRIDSEVESFLVKDYKDEIDNIIRGYTKSV